MKVHEVKSWPEYFNAVARGWKTFELRLNDRDYQVGDEIVLKEWAPSPGENAEGAYTGRELRVKAAYMARPVVGDLAVLALRPGYVAMSVKVVGGGKTT